MLSAELHYEDYKCASIIHVSTFPSNHEKNDKCKFNANICEHEFKIFQGAFPRADYPEVVNTNPHGSIGQSILVITTHITIMVVILVFIKYLRLNGQSETS